MHRESRFWTSWESILDIYKFLKCPLYNFFLPINIQSIAEVMVRIKICDAT